MAELTFPSIDDARRFRAMHANALLDSDDHRSKTVRFDRSELSEEALERAEEQAALGAGQRVERQRRELSEDEKRRLESRRRWTWDRYGLEAMWVKGTVINAGATEWMDFYEAGEGVEGALKNMEASAERSAMTGARSGQRIDRDPDPTSADRMQTVASGSSQRCDHAAEVCRRGDPDACEFLAMECDYTEAEVDAIMGVEPPEPVDEGQPAEAGDSPFTGIQQGALRRAWGGYKGAVSALEAREGDPTEHRRHARQAMAAINSIRATAGQDALEAERLEELERRPTASGTRRLAEAAVAVGAIFLLGALLEALRE